MSSLNRTRAVLAIIAFPTFLATAMAQEKALAPEHNPPGDIPDTQVFVDFASPLGFTIKVPEGWARTEGAQSVRFADKYDAIEVGVSSKGVKPTLQSVKSNDVAEIEKAGRAVKVVKLKDVKLKSGAAILIS